eukprot:SAG31_NODE_16730_length_698_cov_1.040067_1_plen_91_part_00
MSSSVQEAARRSGVAALAELAERRSGVAPPPVGCGVGEPAGVCEPGERKVVRASLFRIIMKRSAPCVQTPAEVLGIMGRLVSQIAVQEKR